MPSAANLNLYRGGNSRVNWHSDDEPLFGGSGVHKLIVSVSLGAPVLFKWRGRSCLDSGERSCWLGHGDILVMDGQCQDEFLHCTMLRSVGLDSILTSVLCSRQEWYVVYQLVRKVHPFKLWGIWDIVVFGLSGFFFVFCAC